MVLDLVVAICYMQVVVELRKGLQENVEHVIGMGNGGATLDRIKCPASLLYCLNYITKNSRSRLTFILNERRPKNISICHLQGRKQHLSCYAQPYGMCFSLFINHSG